MKLRSLADSPEEGVSHDPALTKRVLLRGGEVPHLAQLARTRLAPGQSTTPHAHAGMHEVFLVQSGAGELLIEGTPHPLHPGVCAVVEPGEVHEIRCNGEEELELVYFGLVE